MPPLITFIGWHNSGKTTLASKVVALLKTQGFRVGVIKSTKDTGIEPENSRRTDTATHWRAGADGVALVSPDQLFVRYRHLRLDLHTLAQTYFPGMDLVIAEGFKHAAGVAKIEVRRDAQAPMLRDQVEGVIAVATDLPCAGEHVFTLDQISELTAFILEHTGQTQRHNPALKLTINDQPVPCPPAINRECAALLQILRQSGVLGPSDSLELRVTSPCRATGLAPIPGSATVQAQKDNSP